MNKDASPKINDTTEIEIAEIINALLVWLIAITFDFNSAFIILGV